MESEKTMTATVEKITYTATPEQIERMHQAFDEALEAAPSEFGKTYPMIVNGQERTGAGTFEVRAPANRDIVRGHFQRGTKQDVDAAFAGARAASPAGPGRPFIGGVGIMRRAAELIREGK